MQEQQQIQPNNNNIQPKFDDIENNDLEGELEEGGELNIPNINQVVEGEKGEIDEQEVVNRQLKINTITEYKRVIGHQLGAFEEKFDIDYLNGLSSEELDKLITQIEVCAGGSNSASLIQPMIKCGLGFMERAGSKLGMKWEGLQNQLMISEEFNRNITLIKLKYGRSLYVNPIVTLGITILQTAMYTDHNNRLKETLEEHGKLKVDKKVVDEFKDL